MKELLVEEARPMYEAANRFKAQSSWKWMSSSHIFGVQDPESDQIGYCSIMGNGGEMFGMAVYFGGEGFNFLVDLINGDIDQHPMYLQHCLLLSFDQRSELSAQEYKQLKQLGYSYRGRNAWPTFQLYEPGYVPCPIFSDKHMRFFATCIEQAIEVANEVRNEPDILFPEDGVHILTRVPSSRSSQRTWKSQWIAPHLDHNNEAVDELTLPNEFYIEKIRRIPAKHDCLWEFGNFHLPFATKDKERDYFPKVMLVTEPSSGLILHSTIESKQVSAQQCLNELVQLVLRLEYKPMRLVLSDTLLAQSLLPAMKSFDIEVFTTERLLMAEDCMEDMIQSLGRSPF